MINKAKKFKEKQARKAQGQADRPTYTRMRGETDNTLGDEASDSEIMEELAYKFKAPPPAVAAVRSDKKPDAIAALTKTYEEQDATAVEVFREFCDEVNCIVDDYPARLPDDDFRGEYCDALMHRYLSLKMDKMMATRTVAKVRKHVAAIIEQFAASDDVAKLSDMMQSALEDCRKTGPVAKGDNLPPVGASATAPAENSGVPSSNKVAAKESKSLIKPDKSTVSSNPTLPIIDSKKNATGSTTVATKTSSEPANASSSNSTDQPVATADKQKLEKQRIKAQYEQLMSLKKKTENHPDDNTINEYTSLHADIQSVIDSIQQRPAVPADTKIGKKATK